ncbi:hypothetical protein ACA910_019666 [Epithemia clementina (nom. ined.)]
MTPKDAFSSNDHSDNESASESNADIRTKQQDAIDALRSQGLLPRSRTQLVYGYSYTSWYCSSSSSDDESSADDESDSDQEENEDSIGSAEEKPRCPAHGKILVGTDGVSHLVSTFTTQSFGNFNCGGSQCPTPTSRKQDADNQKWEQDEAMFLSNLRRRSIRFVEQPDVKEFEAAPFHLHVELYYSCHQLQIMMDEANAEKLQQQQEQQQSSAQPTLVADV